MYYGTSICIVTFASAMAVITLNIHHRGFRGVTVPKFLSFLIIRVLGRVLLIQREPPLEEPDARECLDSFKEIRLQLNVSKTGVKNILFSHDNFHR